MTQNIIGISDLSRFWTIIELDSDVKVTYYLEIYNIGP